jgi:hypothetical protein
MIAYCLKSFSGGILERHQWSFRKARNWKICHISNHFELSAEIDFIVRDVSDWKYCRHSIQCRWFSDLLFLIQVPYLEQGRRLRFASGGIIMAGAASLKNYFARRGDNPPTNRKTNNAGLKVGGSIPLIPLRCRRLWSGAVQSSSRVCGLCAMTETQIWLLEAITYRK